MGKCPFCREELEYYGREYSNTGFKVSFVCNNNDCEDGEEKVFFSYIDFSNLEW
ncbi:hypothetical protein ABIC55_003467 [Sporosarcina psychrophila]|uniref:Restriction alleviation protein, Lar family n=1 Tax=Sporosarcina psychrophila TaxID=1476 RepID=A0ABV2KB97_SPOPS